MEFLYLQQIVSFRGPVLLECHVVYILHPLSSDLQSGKREEIYVDVLTMRVETGAL